MMVISESTKISDNVYEVGATVEYQCDGDSLLVGPLNRTCLDTGFYNEFPPVCKCKKHDRGMYSNEIITNVTRIITRFHRFRYRLQLSREHKIR